MLIRELTKQASLELLGRAHLGRLACAQGGQPYVVPISFVYHHDCLYCFCTVGQKIEWMRANPLVSLETDEIVNTRRWASVVVFGRYEELPDTPEWSIERAMAAKLLQENAMWWEPAYVKTILHGTERPLMPLFYRIHVTHITGRAAAP